MAYLGRPEIKERWTVEDRGYESPCWVWQLYCDRHGYGVLYRDSRTQLAHRYYFEKERGAIPQGLQLDHLCRNPPCVKPDHLEPVTHAENMRRGSRATATHCKHGHEYTPANTYVPPSGKGRYCRACNGAAHERRRQRLARDRENL